MIGAMSRSGVCSVTCASKAPAGVGLPPEEELLGEARGA